MDPLRKLKSPAYLQQSFVYLHLMNSNITTSGRLKKAGTIILIICLPLLFICMNISPALPGKRSCQISDRDSLVQVYHYIGAEKCATECHNNEKSGFQYNLWKKSGHAEAFRDLFTTKAKAIARKAHLPGNPYDTGACLKCHTTAPVHDTTYLSATYQNEDGVTCEACHKHYDNPKTFIPSEKDCLACHNNYLHPVPVFNFRENVKKIHHPRPERS
jgi:hypothetical protein